MSAVLSGRLRAILDHLTTHLGSTRMAKVDTINSNVDAAITTRAAASNPLLLPPKASGLTLTATASGVAVTNRTILAGTGGAQVSEVSSTTLTDAINYTGSGLLTFLCVGSGVAAGAKLTVIIDGTTVLTTASTGGNSMYAVVGGIIRDSDDTTNPVGVTFEAIPFKTSLQIQHASATTGTSYCVFKVTKTS